MKIAPSFYDFLSCVEHTNHFFEKYPEYSFQCHENELGLVLLSS